MRRNRLRYLAIMAHAKAKRLARIAADRKAERELPKPVVEQQPDASRKPH